MENINAEIEELNKLLETSGPMENEKEVDEEKVNEKMAELIEKVTSEATKGVSQDEKEEMQSKLEKQLNFVYRDSIESYVAAGMEDKVNDIIEEQANLWKNKSLEQRKSELLRDEAKENIISASNTALEMAKERIKEGKIQTDEELYNRLKNVLKDTTKIKEFNKKKVEEDVSEGLVDLDFAFGFTECTSLRIGRYR